MKSELFTNNWKQEIQFYKHDSIGDDYIIFENPAIFDSLSYPYKLDMTFMIMCTQGSVEGMIDLMEFNEKAPCTITILVNQILTLKKFNDDFKGHFVFLSTPFLENLFMDKRLNSKLYLKTKKNPIKRLNRNDLLTVEYFYKMIKRTIRLNNNLNRLEIVKHMMLAFYYMFDDKVLEVTNESEESKNEILIKEFLDLVSINFKKYRGMEFYAKKLFLTPKYLSKLVKQTTGKLGNEWINEYVILEAKALLKSTNLSIQQISDRLNFPTQSFFGKYFKRHAGVSPKQYRINR